MDSVAEFINEGVKAVQKRERYGVPIHAQLFQVPDTVGYYYDACRLVLTSQKESRSTSAHTLIPSDAISRLALKTEHHVAEHVAGIVKPQIIQHQAYWHSGLWC